MRAVIQRVKKASVSIHGSEYSSVSEGLLIFVGIEESDTSEDVEWLSGKITRLRIFNDAQGIMNLPVTATGGEIMVVSQFTLHASTKKGNRPSYVRAAHPDFAKKIYNQFIKQIEKDSQRPVKTGIFGAMMNVYLINDGPVTIIIDTKNKE